MKSESGTVHAPPILPMSRIATRPWVPKYTSNDGGAGDCLWYSNTFATVHKFGLLNTQLILTNGSMVWVRSTPSPPSPTADFRYVTSQSGISENHHWCMYSQAAFLDVNTLYRGRCRPIVNLCRPRSIYILVEASTFPTNRTIISNNSCHNIHSVLAHNGKIESRTFAGSEPQPN